MRFAPGQHVHYRSTASDKIFGATIARAAKDGWYVIRYDLNGRPIERVIHGNKIGGIQIPKGQVFA